MYYTDMTFVFVAFQPAHSVKEFYDFYRLFHGAYFNEIEEHAISKDQLKAKEDVLKVVTKERDNNKVSKSDIGSGLEWVLQGELEG